MSHSLLENETYDWYIRRITGDILSYNEEIYIYSKEIIDEKIVYIQDLGTFNEGIFNYKPTNTSENDYNLSYPAYSLLWLQEVPEPEGYELFIKDVNECTPTMNYIYSKQNSRDIIMSEVELTTTDIGDYTKYTITN